MRLFVSGTREEARIQPTVIFTNERATFTCMRSQSYYSNTQTSQPTRGIRWAPMNGNQDPKQNKLGVGRGGIPLGRQRRGLGVTDSSTRQTFLHMPGPRHYAQDVWICLREPMKSAGGGIDDMCGCTCTWPTCSQTTRCVVIRMDIARPRPSRGKRVVKKIVRAFFLWDAMSSMLCGHMVLRVVTSQFER